jgi:hypothetical protein
MDEQQRNRWMVLGVIAGLLMLLCWYLVQALGS